MTKSGTAKTSTNVAKLSFEEALAELESIVQKLERGDVALEESIEIYERGTALKSHCEAKLASAKAKVEKITLSADGSVSAEPANIS